MRNAVFLPPAQRATAQLDWAVISQALTVGRLVTGRELVWKHRQLSTTRFLDTRLPGWPTWLDCFRWNTS